MTICGAPARCEPDDQDLKLRLDLISQTLSDYYVAQAKKYLEKPLGSGVGVAWLYLNEAQQYKSNRDDIRDERTKNSAIHNVRSTLSIKVVFRDQTSRRDSAGFADQLSDAIATGLETTDLPVRIIRAADTTPVEPNFQLIGDVLEHRPVTKVTIESIDSEYRAAEREVPNEEWNQANRDYEAATLELQKAQKLLEGTQAHGKKKEIAAATRRCEDAQKKVEDAHRKLDSIPKTTLSDVVKPYSYTQKTIDLSAVVDVGFRIVDSNGNTIATTPSVKNTAQKQFIVLENVKPEDTKNVKQAGSPPDEAQFLTDVEIAARIALIKDVREKVELLPSKILAQARKQVHGRRYRRHGGGLHSLPELNPGCSDSRARGGQEVPARAIQHELAGQLRMIGPDFELLPGSSGSVGSTLDRTFWALAIRVPTAIREGVPLAPSVSDKRFLVTAPNIKRIGKYEVIDLLGRGGMGLVYRAFDRQLNREVAIKTVTEGFTGDQEMLQRFYREAAKTGALRHPNIVIVHDLGEQDGFPYIVMEYLSGEPLDKLIQSSQPLPLAYKLKIIEQVCYALGYAHRNDMIHRDVKPANVIVQPDGVAKAAGLRNRPPGQNRRPPHSHRACNRHYPVHGARAPERRSLRRPLRHFFRRSHDVSASHRTASVHRRLQHRAENIGGETSSFEPVPPRVSGRTRWHS